MPWTVNGEPIDETAVSEQVRIMRPRYEQEVSGMDPLEAEMQLKDWARENVIEQMLLQQTALSQAEPVPAEIYEQGLEAARTEAGGQAGCGLRTSEEEIRAQIETEYRLRRLVQRVYESAPALKAKEAADFYKKNREQFRSPERIYAKHIVQHINEQKDEETARAAIDHAQSELTNGIAFEEAADRYSDCPGNGGDLGWFPRGEMVDEFDAVAFESPVGAVSSVFRTVFGFHIVKVMEKRPAGYLPLDEVKASIENVLLEARREEALAKYLDGLRAKAVVRRV